MTQQKLNTLEAAVFLGVKPNTLEVWRCQKRGPKYSKIGRRVLYDINDLENYFVSCSVYTKETVPQLAHRQ
jgi:hypothetical protein